MSARSQSSDEERTSERRESLWPLVWPLLVWLLHFLASYATAAVWCAKVADALGSLAGARITVGAYTAVALALLGALALRGYRRHKHGEGDLPHDGDTAESRHRFLGFASLLLSLLGIVAVLYGAGVVLFIGDCR